MCTNVKHMDLPFCAKMHAAVNDIEVGTHTHTHTHTDAEGTRCRYERWWVASRDGSAMTVQCVLRVFKWVKSQLWLPDGGGLIWIILTGLHFDVLLPITDITWRQAYFSLITSNSSMPVQCMACLTHQGYRGSASVYVCINYHVRAPARAYLLCCKYVPTFIVDKSVDVYLSHIKQAVKTFSIDVHFHKRVCSGQARLRFCSGCVSAERWLFSWRFIVNLQFWMKSKRTGSGRRA